MGDGPERGRVKIGMCAAKLVLIYSLFCLTICVLPYTGTIIR